MSGQFPPKKLSVAILSRLCYLQRRLTGLNQPDIQPAEKYLLIDCNKPTREEIERAIGHIQNGKSARPDGIPAEALKGDVTTSVENVIQSF